MYDALSAHWLPLIPSTKFARLLKGRFITVIEKACRLLRQ